MKKILILMTLLLSFLASARDNNLNDNHNHDVSAKLNMIIKIISSDNATEAEATTALLDHYYPYNILAVAIGNPSTDENNKTLTDKIIEIGNILKTKFGVTENTIIGDFIIHEAGCAAGGSC